MVPVYEIHSKAFDILFESKVNFFLIQVAGFLYELLTHYGVAKIVMSDQGREFVNKVNQKLFELCGTDHRISSAYHPQTNGLDERMNQTLKSALVKYVNDNQNDWDVYLNAVLFAYRASKNDSTKFTPFELMFGRPPVLPIEIEIKSKPNNAAHGSLTSDTEEDITQKVDTMMSMRDQIKSQAMENIGKAQERQKKAYNARHQPPAFKKGDVCC